MKEITSSEVEKLLAIIQHAPLLRIGHFSSQGEILPASLLRYCESNAYEYILNCTDLLYHEKLQDRCQKSSACQIRLFDLARPNYMQQGKFYDYLFVTCDIPTKEIESFLKKSHKVIKNAGLILLFIPTAEHRSLALWTQLLEENYFVATNTIGLDKEWSVIISKKMHGWGG